MVGLYMIYLSGLEFGVGPSCPLPCTLFLAFRIQTLLSLRRSGMNSNYGGDCLKKNFTAKL